jgi:hypothetical protein
MTRRASSLVTSFALVVASSACNGRIGDAHDASSDITHLDVHADDAVSDDADAAPDRADASSDVVYDGTVGMFVAQGYVGRTTISCDDGRTWVADRSDDPTLRCFADTMSDCDHNGARGMGLDYGDGWFVASWGWGAPGSIRRSRDGVNWERVVDASIFAGLNFGNGRFVAFDEQPSVSTDDGMTFTRATTPIGFGTHIRGAGFGGDHFVAAGAETADAGTVMVSGDGVAWQRPTSIPASCGVAVSADGVAFGRGALLLAHNTGLVCRSTDGGQTWTMAMVDGTIDASLIDNGSEFVTWGIHADTRVMFRSTDGITWTFEPTQLRNTDGTITAGPAVGPVARSNSSGTFVSVKSGWQVWYDQQVFYRSTDGITWEALPTTAFTPSHPILFIRYGVANRSAACP